MKNVIMFLCLILAGCAKQTPTQVAQAEKQCVDAGLVVTHVAWDLNGKGWISCGAIER